MDPSQITVLLAGPDRRDAVDAVLPLVYDELEVLARRHLRADRGDHTLDTAALVHEAYLKLVDQSETDWKSRAHFYGIAAIAMRRILVQYARRRTAQKRGGGEAPVTLIDDRTARDARPEELVALDEALDRLGAFAERPARVVELTFFGGLTQTEAAEVLGVSEPTVRRDWRLARAWLARELGETP
ncbi:MAG: ECF-type sigma factor [Bacteroidota bacterium]